MNSTIELPKYQRMVTSFHHDVPSPTDKWYPAYPFRYAPTIDLTAYSRLDEVENAKIGPRVFANNLYEW